MRTNPWHCGAGRGWPQKKSRDARARGGRGAKGAKDGRVAAAPPFPCATGNSGKKFCSGLVLRRKSHLIIALHASFQANRGRGRESSKIPGSPFGIDPSTASRYDGLIIL